MSAPQPPPTARPLPIDGGDSILMSLISAGLFLYVGFMLGLVGISGNPIYDGSVAAFTWGARIVGIGLLVVVGLNLVRLPGAAMLDLFLSALAALGCLVVGVIWLAFGDMQGFLLLLFGLLNASAMKAAWTRWRTVRFFARATPPDPME